MGRKKKLLFSVLTMFFALIVLEGALQLLSLISPKVKNYLSVQPEISMSIEDEWLVSRPSPDYPDHDQNGFRNRNVPEEVSVVAMGDSQTYGVGVPRSQAWPQMLGKRGRIETYNMAHGGYGPTHALMMLPEAMRLRPEFIIEAFYPGNDLYDAYVHVYLRKQFPGFRSKDEKVIEEINRAEQFQSLPELRTRIGKLWKSKKRNREGLGELLASSCKICGFVNALGILELKNTVNREREWDFASEYASVMEEYCQTFVAGEIKTVFTPGYRFIAVNVNDIRIKEGLRAALNAIAEINIRAVRSEIGFLVLLVPTKELVFKEVVYNHNEAVPEDYRNLIQYEELVWSVAKQFFQDQGIGYIDPLPVLREYLGNGEQPYKVTWDGHPNSIGHKAIAEAVWSELEKRNVL